MIRRQPQASEDRAVSASSCRRDTAGAAERHGLQCPRHGIPETRSSAETFAALRSERLQQAALVQGRRLACLCPKLTPLVLCA